MGFSTTCSLSISQGDSVNFSFFCTYTAGLPGYERSGGSVTSWRSLAAASSLLFFRHQRASASHRYCRKL